MIGEYRKLASRRHGVILLLTVFLIVVLLGVVAFSVDLGCIVLARTQLQVAADSAALAGAAAMHRPRDEMEDVTKEYASQNSIGDKPIQVLPQDIEYGTWDSNTRTFTPSDSPSNAVRVTARANQSTSGEIPLFFARIFNRNSANVQASAVAMGNPRDIVFVVDLSGSMHYDTDPEKTAQLNREFAGDGYPNIGTELMQQVYEDFGFGDFPGPSQCIGAPLGISAGGRRGGNPLDQLSDKNGPLSSSRIDSKYRIGRRDSSSVRRRKAYSWAIDVQLPQIMPAAKPTPNSDVNYNYWVSYLNDRYNGQTNYYDIGYESYTHFMMYHDRDGKPDGVNYTPLSQHSSDCPWHSETTDGGVFSFPPREQPTHAARRAIIAALQIVKERNETVADENQRDWVSIVTFDHLRGSGPEVRLSLTGDYDAAMQACTSLQACTIDVGSSTATESGLILGKNHIKPQNEGGQGRQGTNKIVVLLTDGMPNLYSSSRSEIAGYIAANPSGDFYDRSSKYAQDAGLMQASIMNGKNWYLFPVGIGLGTDYGFMDRMARMGGTADNEGESPRGTGNPAEYENRLTEIFRNIITNPKLRLVQ